MNKLSVLSSGIAPPVSLVVVNFDRIHSLGLLLKGLEYQRYQNFELIVVSNLPPEKRPASPLPIRWISFTERNISKARNLGIAEASGDVIAFCDDDAVPEFAWLAHLVGAFRHDHVGCAGGFVRGRNGVGFQWKCMMIDRLGRDRRIELGTNEIAVFPAGPHSCLKTVGTNCAFRRDALQAIGGFDEGYHFYLDEADVNIRLADAGWAGAIVPLAEVHHGYAEGPYRNRHRVPKSLFEIGASEAYFLQKHGDKAKIAPQLKYFEKHQSERLHRLFSLGLVTERKLRDLMASLQDGFEEGKARSEAVQEFTPKGGKFKPVDLRSQDAERALFVSKAYRPTGYLRARAAEAAAAGHEVTLIEPELSHRNLAVRFDKDGYWVHRFGLGGYAERQSPRPLKPVHQRVAAEIERISLQRNIACESM